MINDHKPIMELNDNNNINNNNDNNSNNNTNSNRAAWKIQLVIKIDTLFNTTLNRIQ